MAYGNLNNFNQAFADSNMAIQLGANIEVPINLAVAYQMRGLCYQQMGDNEKAQADFSMSRQLGYFPNGN